LGIFFPTRGGPRGPWTLGGPCESPPRTPLFTPLHGWLILQVKAQHNSNVINKSKNKIKASWAVVNSSLGNEVDRKRGIEKLIINDTVIENPLQIANILNKTFVVNNNDSVMIPDLSHIPKNHKLFFLTTTTPGEVLKISHFQIILKLQDLIKFYVM
jgi:hypothetical protein